MPTLEELFFGGSGGTSGSADVNAFSKSIAESDPYSFAARKINENKLDPSMWTPNQSLAANTAQAFMAGLLGAAGERNQENQLASVTKILPQLYADPTSILTPDGVDEGSFQRLKANAIQKQAIEKAALKKTLLTTYGADIDENGNITSNQGLVDAAQILSGAKHPGGKVDLNDPNLDPDFKKALIDAGGDSISARQLMRQREAMRKEGIDIPEPVKQRWGIQASAISEARDLATTLTNSKTTWAGLRAAKNFSGLDQEGIGLRFKDLADVLGRARSGAALNANEEKLYRDLVGGDYTASPAQVTNLLNKLSDTLERMGTKEFDAIKKMNKGENPFESVGADQVQTSAPKMKRQVNIKTGEVRFVPYG